jgi:predicted nucleic-acid-binding protein
MRAIDTNVLVRLIARDDSRQAAAAEAFVEKGAWVSVLALAEATWVLATVYELSSKDLAKMIEMLLDHRDLVLQDSEAVQDALKLFKAKPALGFSDCLMLHVAQKAGHLPLGTFDRSLAKVDGTQEL